MTDLNDRMHAELDREALVAENARLRDQVERLLAGSAPHAPAPGAEPNPGQWIALFLSLDAHGRRDIAAAAIEQGRRAARCLEQDHENKLQTNIAFLQNLCSFTASLNPLPDKQLHIEWINRPETEQALLIAPDQLSELVERHNALVRELATVTTERTAAWQAYADVTGEHQAAEAQQQARAAAEVVSA